MQRIYIFLLLSLPFTAFAQRSAELSGKVSGDVSNIVFSYSPLDIGEEGVQQTVPLNGGAFKVDLKIEQPEIVQVTCGKKSFDIFVEPAAKLNLNFDGTALDGKVLFGGDLTRENEFYTLYQDIFRSELNPEFMTALALKSTVDLFELDLFDRQASMKQALAKAPSKETFSNNFASYMKFEVDYWYDRWMKAFPILRANVDEKSMTVVHLPRTIEDGFKMEKLNQERGLISATYRDYIYYHITYGASKAHQFAKFKDYNKSVEYKSEAAMADLNGTTRTWYLSRLIYENCEKVSPGTMNKVREHVKREVNGDKFYPTLEEKCAQAVASQEAAAKEEPNVKESKSKKKSKGPSLYPFRMVDLDGNERSLDEFAGKVVYIDFWASWCGPCRGQFPHSKKMHAQLEDKLGKKGMKDIVFLYVSIDKDEKAWRKAVDQYKLQGVMTHSPGNWRDGAASFFGISGIPRYMILDKEGNMVYKNAPRPSQTATMGIILELLGT